MVKRTHTICRQQPTNYLSVFDPFVGWRLKGFYGSNYYIIVMENSSPKVNRMLIGKVDKSSINF